MEIDGAIIFLMAMQVAVVLSHCASFLFTRLLCPFCFIVYRSVIKLGVTLIGRYHRTECRNLEATQRLAKGYNSTNEINGTKKFSSGEHALASSVPRIDKMDPRLGKGCGSCYNRPLVEGGSFLSVALKDHIRSMFSSGRLVIYIYIIVDKMDNFEANKITLVSTTSIQSFSEILEY